MQASAIAREIMGETPELSQMEERLTIASRNHLATLLQAASLGTIGEPMILITDCHPRHMIARCVEQHDGTVGVTVEALDIA